MKSTVVHLILIILSVLQANCFANRTEIDYTVKKLFSFPLKNNCYAAAMDSQGNIILQCPEEKNNGNEQNILKLDREGNLKKKVNFFSKDTIYFDYMKIDEKSKKIYGIQSLFSTQPNINIWELNEQEKKIIKKDYEQSYEKEALNDWFFVENQELKNILYKEILENQEMGIKEKYIGYKTKYRTFSIFNKEDMLYVFVIKSYSNKKDWRKPTKIHYIYTYSKSQHKIIKKVLLKNIEKKDIKQGWSFGGHPDLFQMTKDGLFVFSYRNNLSSFDYPPVLFLFDSEGEFRGKISFLEELRKENRIVKDYGYEVYPGFANFGFYNNKVYVIFLFHQENKKGVSLYEVEIKKK